MTESKEARNKALVLKAFDTLFNKRDYAAAEHFWSPKYIQHSAHIEPGREGLMNLIKSLPPTLNTSRARSSPTAISSSCTGDCRASGSRGTGSSPTLYA